MKNCPPADTSSARWWPSKVPGYGHEICPGWVLVDGRGGGRLLELGYSFSFQGLGESD